MATIENKLPKENYFEFNGQNYLIRETTGRDCIAIQGQKSGEVSCLHIFSKDGDGSDNIALAIFGVGNPDNIDDRERLIWRWDSASDRYEIRTESGGTGAIKEMSLYTGANINQILLKSDGTVEFAQLLINSILETGANKQLISVTKQSAYNKNYGTSAGTTLEGDKNANIVSNTAAIALIESGYSRRKAVIGIVDNTAVPPTEVSGDRYIIDFTGGAVNAAWDGAAKGDIVEFNGTTWDAKTPLEGYIAYSDSDNKDALYVDDGTPDWELRAPSTFIAFTEKNAVIATTSGGAWVTRNISDADKVVEVVILVGLISGLTGEVGIRVKGSSLERKFVMAKSTEITLSIQLDSAGDFEIYSDKTNVTFNYTGFIF